jgi:hypothetical protein
MNDAPSYPRKRPIRRFRAQLERMSYVGRGGLLSRLRSKVQAETQLALPVQTFRNQGFAFAQ